MQNSEIIELFKKIVEESNECATSKMILQENNEKKQLRELWRDYNDYIQKIGKVEKLTTLIPLITNSIFQKMLPMLVLPASEILSGDMHRVEDMRRLQDALNKDESYLAWEKLSESFKQIMESMGLTAETDLYADILGNVHILVDAFSFLESFDFSGKDKYGSILQVRSGKPGQKEPVFINSVTVLRNQYEIVQCCENSGLDSFIMFAAERMINADTNSYMDDWLGFNERKRNWMRNEHIESDEEYFAKEDIWKRKVYLVVKNGENIWLLPDSCSSNQSPARDFYEYGKRKSYFPYQVLFEEFSGMPEGTTMLTTANNSYALNKFVDEEQKIYIPILMYEAKRRFFDDELPVVDKIVLPQESVLKLPVAKNASEAKITSALAVTNNAHEQIFEGDMYSIDTLFAESPKTLRMIKILEITEKDIETAPVLPTSESKTISEYEQLLQKNLKTAYVHVLESRLKEITESEKELVKVMMGQSFAERKEILKRMLEQGTFVQYSNDIVNKKYCTTSSDAHRYGVYDYGRENPQTIYPDEKITPFSNVPVCVEVRPFTKVEILEFYGWQDDDTLPFTIRYRDEILDYWGVKRFDRNDKAGIINVKGMNAIMGVKYYKKFLEPYYLQKECIKIVYTNKYETAAIEILNLLKCNNYEIKQYYNFENHIIAAYKQDK